MKLPKRVGGPDRSVILQTLSIILVASRVSAIDDSNDLLLTSKEKNALNKFTMKVKNSLPEDFMKTDFYLIRWLRETNFDISAAEAMLQESIKWRGDTNITNMLSETWTDMEQDFLTAVDSHDKEGRPILDMRIGSWDIRRAALQGKSRRLLRYLQYLLEKSMQNVFRSQEKGKLVTRYLVIVDIDGFSIPIQVCPLCIPVLVQWTMSMTKYYPRFSKEIILVNAPPTIQVALNVVRPVMSPELRGQFRVFNTQKSKWISYLKDRVDDDQLDSNYGGTKAT